MPAVAYFMITAHLTHGICSIQIAQVVQTNELGHESASSGETVRSHETGPSHPFLVVSKCIPGQYVI